MKLSDQDRDIGTTGHEWDGIHELNNPLPRWWLWIFYLTIIWGIGYTIAYPAWPMLTKATSGVLGYSTRGELSQEIERFKVANADVAARLASADLSTLADTDPDAYQFAVSGGAAIFLNFCSQCHGSGAAGAPGYPNLLDDDWLWGGDIEAILYTIRHGIRNEEDFDARWSEMPAFGDILEPAEIDQVVHYVGSLTSSFAFDPGLAAPGLTVYADNCASCHGDAAQGDPELGAPNLSDAIWLYGGDADSLTQTVTYSRFGVMPPWAGRLDAAELAAVAAYVHQLCGGE